MLGVVLGKKARGVCIQQFTGHMVSWHPSSVFPRLEQRDLGFLLFLKRLLPTPPYLGTLLHTVLHIFLALPISDRFEAVVQILLILNSPCCQLGI